jgi:hypothetical protein
MPENPRKLTPPYVPWRTFETYVEGLKAFGPALPNVIDRDSMRTFSGATQSWLLSSLRYLNMIDDDGVPRPRLKQIVDATPEQRRDFYKQVISAEYKFLEGINLQGATPKQIESAFESAGASGDTVRKSIGFFIGMAKAAGIPLSPLIGKTRRRPTNGGTPKTKKTKTPATRTSQEWKQPPIVDQPQAKATPFQVLYELLDPDLMDDAEQQAVWTLLRFIKKQDGGS